MWLDINTAPRDGTIILVYDPKPSPEYGPDIHKAYFDNELDMFVATDDVETDPYDLDPELWSPVDDINDESLR